MIFVGTMQIDCMQSSNTENSNDQASLISFINEHEQSLINLQKKRDQLWNSCKGTEPHRYENFPYTRTYINTSAPFEDLQSLYQALEQIKSWDREFCGKISQSVDQGQSLDAIDDKGKTALDYARFYYTYNVLRSQGASFQVVPFLYMHPYYTIPAAIILAYKAYCWGRYADTRLMQHQELYDISCLSSRDEQLRTPLMNYLIDQEAKLVNIRSTIKKLEKDAYKSIDDYYVYKTTLIEHHNVIEKTQATIKNMIEQGAQIDICDIHGKSLTDYCYTKEIYDSIHILSEQQIKTILSNMGISEKEQIKLLK